MTNPSITQCGVFRDRAVCPTADSARQLARAQETTFVDTMGNVTLDRFEEAPTELAKNRAALDRIAKQVENPVGWFFAETVAVSYGAWASFNTKSVEITAGIPMFVGALVSGDIRTREMVAGVKAMGVHAYDNLGHAWDAAKAGRLSEATYLATGSVTDFAMLGQGAAGASHLVKAALRKAQAVGEALANMAGGDGGALATVSSAGSTALPASVPAVAVASAGGSDLLPVVVAMITHDGENIPTSLPPPEKRAAADIHVSLALERIASMKGLFVGLRRYFALSKLLDDIEMGAKAASSVKEGYQWMTEADGIRECIHYNWSSFWGAVGLEARALAIATLPDAELGQYTWVTQSSWTVVGAGSLKTTVKLPHTRMIRSEFPLVTGLDSLPRDGRIVKYLIQEDAKGVPRIRWGKDSHTEMVERNQGEIIGAGYMEFNPQFKTLEINGRSGSAEVGRVELPRMKELFKDIFGDEVDVLEVWYTDL